MRKLTDLFLIDGRPMLAPDEDMEVSMEDIDAADSGRDESAVMHRIVVRRGVGKWTFSYSHLTQQEYAYMESLFAGKATFRFTYPDCAAGGQAKTIAAYRSKHGILWQSAATGQFRNYGFSVIGC
jgi:hypothetical protein